VKLPAPLEETPLAGMRSSARATEVHKMGAIEEAVEWVAVVTGAPPPDVARGGRPAFQAWLKSGELLCELVNCIRPGSVKKIATSAMPFKQMENIGSYIEACAAIGVPSQDLFMTVDLFEGKNLDAIVRNIHSLGRVAQTVSTFNGPHLGAKLATKHARNFTEEQLILARATPARWTNLGRTIDVKDAHGRTSAASPHGAGAGSGAS